MSSEHEIIEERRKKRDRLQAAGHNPYTALSHQTHTLKEVVEQFTTLSSEGSSVTVAGRVVALRLHGAIAFADLFDGTERFQVMLTGEHLGDSYDLFVDTIDVGDFVEVTGVPFVTKRETHAIQTHAWQVLTKALNAIPTEHFGLKDEDARYRRPQIR